MHPFYKNLPVNTLISIQNNTFNSLNKNTTKKLWKTFTNFSPTFLFHISIHPLSPQIVKLLN